MMAFMVNKVRRPSTLATGTDRLNVKDLAKGPGLACSTGGSTVGDVGIGYQ